MKIFVLQIALSAMTIIVAFGIVLAVKIIRPDLSKPAPPPRR